MAKQRTTYYLNGRFIGQKDLPKNAKLIETKKIEISRTGTKTRTFEKYYETPKTAAEIKKIAESESKFFENLRGSDDDIDNDSPWHGTDNHGWTS